MHAGAVSVSLRTPKRTAALRDSLCRDLAGFGMSDCSFTNKCNSGYDIIGENVEAGIGVYTDHRLRGGDAPLGIGIGQVGESSPNPVFIAPVRESPKRETTARLHPGAFRSLCRRP
jgi:hypothetical protein